MTAHLLVILLGLLPSLPCLHTLSYSVVSDMTTSDPTQCTVEKCPVKLCNQARYIEEKSKCLFLYCPNNTSCDVKQGANTPTHDHDDGVLHSPTSKRPSDPPASNQPAGPVKASPPPTPSNSSTKAPQPHITVPVGDPRSEVNSSASSQPSASSSPKSTVKVPPTAPTTTNATTITTTAEAMATTTATTPNATTMNTTTNATTPPPPPLTSALAAHPNTSTTTPPLSTVLNQPPTAPTSITTREPEHPVTTPVTSVLLPPSNSTHPVPSEGGTDPLPSTAKPAKSPSGGQSDTPGAGDGGRDRKRQKVFEEANEPLTSHVVNTSSLLAVLMFGLFFFVVTVVLFLRQAYEGYRRKDYTQVDYLINGMYSDSGL
ncbi:uncharacterized protein C11orf24 homolog [Brachyhypopomus gauderio]|uniref:uncharacterized protein C11orf24 homolog n=1 Tax=Brachyhypopomus gauderio TaxID=698409 RepID=UPI0040432C0A